MFDIAKTKAVLDPLTLGFSGGDALAGEPVTGISYDSRETEPGHVFFALRGELADGNAFVPQALANGAVAIVSDGSPEVPGDRVCIQVTDGRLALASLAAAFHGFPSLDLKTVGVTGTNGKTTTGFLLHHLCKSAWQRCGLIGTVHYDTGGDILAASHTTPESVDLQGLLRTMADQACRGAVMEVSSHGLSQGRVEGIEFDAAIFTNLTQDHLDYHGDMESYFEAKGLLFAGLARQETKTSPVAVVNLDDLYGKRVLANLPESVRTLTYGMGASAEFRASDARSDRNGTTYQLEARGKSYLVRLPLIGRFNVYNSLAALAGAAALRMNIREAVHHLADAPQVPGRLENVSSRQAFRVFVDYAHTDDALTNAARTLRDLSPRRLIIVFGCGGDRDKTKRPLMGRAAEEAGDLCFVTSDNPRGEEPGAIINDIVAGFRSDRHEVFEDRREAIAEAVMEARPGDIILIAGKGHETGQTFAGETIPFDDREVARQCLLDHGAKHQNL